MSTLTVSPLNAKVKTKNAILRIKKCSPKLKAILRERCKERINNERLKILSEIRKIKIQESFLTAFGNILCEEWKNIEDDELGDRSLNLPSQSFSLEDELVLEELLEKELISQHEEWLLQECEEILNENFNEVAEVVCPVCCLGYLQINDLNGFKMTVCTKCPTNFPFDKSIMDLQKIIYEYLEQHNKQCECNPSFVNVPKNDSENNLCILCYQCSFLNVIM